MNIQSLLEPFKKLNETAVLKLEQAKEKNKIIAGVFCAFAPEEIIRAAGAIPVGLCGKSEIPISAAEEILPMSLCPLIKSSFGYAYTDTCPYFAASDFIIGETTCDGKKKMFELLDDIIPTHVMQLPYSVSDRFAIGMWENEVLKLKALIEEKTGNKISDSDIVSQIKLLNKRRYLLKELALLMKKSSPPLLGKELLLIMESRNYAYDTEKYNSLLEELLNKLESYENKELKKRKRILITGCPMGIGTDKILELTEESGGIAVVLENCTGLKSFDRQCPETENPVLALSEFYLNTPCACMSPNKNRLNRLAELAEEFKIDGVIDACLLNCHPYNVESKTVADCMEKSLNIPFIHLETDYSISDTEQLRTRIEAFIEMI
jgi:benzoyl-CoA reductase/2-hydroxyglutaryl-CoA dehydratase subunit BcrC/BadD/HgdB